MNSKMKWFKASVLGLGVILSALVLLMVNSGDMSIAQAQVNQPVISSISPTSGDDNVDTSIVIRGSGFAEPLVVTLDNGTQSQVLTVEYFDSGQINAVVPAGMTADADNPYDLKVSSVGVEATLPDAFTVTPHRVTRDLLSDPTWLWSEPHPMRVGIQNTGVGLLVHHIGHRQSIDQVTVEFRLGSATGTLLGRSETDVIAPLKIESSGKVVWEPQTAGDYTVCAIIDPDNVVEEADESNNTVCRTVRVLNPVPDVTPPQVDSFIIEDGAFSTADEDVTLDLTATEYGNPTPSGLYQVKYLEFEYSFQAQRWVVVNENQSGWLDYNTSRVNHPWNLISTYGTRYMQAWVVDNDLNISEAPGVDIISYPPQDIPSSIPQHGVHFYRILLEEGDSFSATLTPSSGDADLYVWGTSGQLADYSQNFFTEVDTVTFEAPNDGTYQIEVHGYQDSDYSLSFGTTRNLVQAVPQRTFAVAGPKSVPDAANVPVDSVPGTAPPVDLPEPATYTIFLPMTIR